MDGVTSVAVRIAYVAVAILISAVHQDLSHRKLPVVDIFTSSYGPADLTSVSVVMVLGLETL